MKKFLTGLLICLSTIGYSQSVETILVCDDTARVSWIKRCVNALDTTMGQTGYVYYKHECVTSGRQLFCHAERVLLLPKDTVYCATTEKKKWLKICNED